MKIRTTFELSSFLDEELAWRKRELTNLFFDTTKCPREHLIDTRLRAAIPMLYSHWEGFLKLAAQAYLQFVARQRLRYCDLTTNFVTISCRKALNESAASRQTHIQTQLVDFLIYNQFNRARIPVNNVIETESNLSSPVLRNILFTLGIPFDNYWQTKSLLVDGSLLFLRNRIAHGERQLVSLAAYLELHRFILDALDYMKRLIETSAINGTYKR